MPRTYVRYVHEFGLEICRAESGDWSLLRAQHGETPRAVALGEVEAQFSARPVLGVWVDERGRHHTRLLSPDDESPLNYALEAIGSHAFKNSLYGPKMINLEYVLGSACYHCIGMAEAYARACRWEATVEEVAPSPVVPDRETLAAADEAYFEFDALVSALARSYESLRYVLWRSYGSGGEPPSNFEKTLNSLRRRKLVKPLIRMIDRHWSTVGTEIKHYRNCALHFVPLNEFGLRSEVLRLEGEPLTAELLIPDNPEEQDIDSFTYIKRIDALTYGWQRTAAVLDFMYKVVHSLPAPAQAVKDAVTAGT